MRKKTLKIIGVACIILIFTVTNPSKENYVQWVVDSNISHTSSVLEKGFISTVGSYMVDISTTHTDLIIFSVYHTSLDGQQMTSVGLLKNFIEIPFL